MSTKDYKKTTEYFGDADLAELEEIDIEDNDINLIDLDGDLDSEEEEIVIDDNDLDDIDLPDIEALADNDINITEDIVIDDDDEDMFSLETEIDLFGALTDNTSSRSIGVYRDVDSDIESMDEFKEFVINQMKLELDAEQTYIDRALATKYKTNEELYDELRRNHKLLNPEYTVDGVFSIDDYLVWSKAMRSEIVDPENDDKLILSFMNDMFRTYPERCKGFSLPITEQKIYQNTTLLKLKGHLENLFEVTRKAEEDNKRVSERKAHLLMINSIDIKNKLDAKKVIVAEMEESEVVPVKSISYENNLTLNINRNNTFNSVNEDIRFSCGNCGSESKSNTLFHRLNIFNKHITGTSIDTSKYKIERHRLKKKDGSGYRQQRESLGSILSVFYEPCKCSNCGAYNALPVSAMTQLHNYASLLQSEASMSQNTEIGVAMDSTTLRADILAEQLKGILPVTFKYKGLEVIDNNEVTVADIENEFDALATNYKNSISKFKVMDKVLADKDFELFSFIKYITNSSAYGVIDSKVFTEYVCKTINAICRTQLFTTTKLCIDKLRKQISQGNLYLNEYKHASNLVSKLERKEDATVLITIPMDSYNSYFASVCNTFGVDPVGMFNSVEDYQSFKVSEECKQVLADVNTNVIKELSNETYEIEKEISMLQFKLKDPEIFKFLLADDFSTKADDTIFEVLGNDDDTYRFILDVFKNCICNTLFSSISDHFKTNTRLSSTVSRFCDLTKTPDLENGVLNLKKLLTETCYGETSKLVASTIDSSISEIFDLSNSKAIKRLCKAISGKNYIRVCRLLDDEEVLADKLANLRPFFSLDKVSSEVNLYGLDLAEVILEFRGVGFEPEELEQYFITEGHDLPYVANYSKRQDNETLSQYLRRIENSKSTLIDKPFDSVFMKTYNANNWLEKGRINADFFEEYVKMDTREAAVCNIFIRLLQLDIPLRSKLGVFRIDSQMFRNLLYRDLDFNFMEEFENLMLEISTKHTGLGEYLKSVSLATDNYKVFAQYDKSGLLDIYTTITKEETQLFNESEENHNPFVKQDFITFASQVLAQLPNDVINANKTECDEMKKIVETFYT